MPFSHHSHSGQFCGHAKNTLEEVIQTAIAKGFRTFAMTEHIPRRLVDFYPGETEEHTEESLAKLFDGYITEAHRLKDLYSNKIQLFIGFESEYIRPSTLEFVQEILAKHTFDFFVGSVHHMYTIPIDFDQATYEKLERRQVVRTKNFLRITSMRNMRCFKYFDRQSWGISISYAYSATTAMIVSRT